MHAQAEKDKRSSGSHLSRSLKTSTDVLYTLMARSSPEAALAWYTLASLPVLTHPLISLNRPLQQAVRMGQVQVAAGSFAGRRTRHHPRMPACAGRVARTHHAPHTVFCIPPHPKPCAHLLSTLPLIHAPPGPTPQGNTAFLALHHTLRTC